MKRYVILLLLAVLLCCGCAAGNEISSLDVTVPALDGADCILVTFDGSAVMIDTGRSTDAAAVAAELRSQGVAALDALILTSYLPEHAGGAAALLSNVSVNTLYLPAYRPDSEICDSVMAAAEKAGCAVVPVTADRALFLGTAGFELWASPIPYNGANDAEQSLAVAMQYGEHRWVFLGDAGGKWLNTLCYGNYNLTCDVLKLPQHGVWQKNNVELIAFSFARYAIVTDAKAAPADKQTVNGLSLIGCKVKQTKDGDIRLHSDGKSITVH